jgi:hypothetical protein
MEQFIIILKLKILIKESTVFKELLYIPNKEEN